MSINSLSNTSLYATQMQSQGSPRVTSPNNSGTQQSNNRFGDRVQLSNEAQELVRGTKDTDNDADDSTAKSATQSATSNLYSNAMMDLFKQTLMSDSTNQFLDSSKKASINDAQRISDQQNRQVRQESLIAKNIAAYTNSSLSGSGLNIQA